MAKMRPIVEISADELFKRAEQKSVDDIRPIPKERAKLREAVEKTLAIHSEDTQECSVHVRDKVMALEGEAANIYICIGEAINALTLEKSGRGEFIGEEKEAEDKDATSLEEKVRKSYATSKRPLPDEKTLKNGISQILGIYNEHGIDACTLHLQKGKKAHAMNEPNWILLFYLQTAIESLDKEKNQ